MSDEEMQNVVEKSIVITAPPQAVIEVPPEIYNRDKVLTINEFIYETKYEIKTLWIDKFWNCKNKYELIYLGKDIIIWMEYTGSIKTQKQNIIRILHAEFEENKDYFVFDEKYDNIIMVPETRADRKDSRCSENQVENNEKENQPEDRNGRTFPTIPETKVKKKSNLTDDETKHYYLTLECFKLIAMRGNSKRAKQIQRYFVNMEKLFLECALYQNKHSNLLKEREIKLLENTNSQVQNKLTFYIEKDEKNQAENQQLRSDYMNTLTELNQFKKTHNFFKFGTNCPTVYYLTRIPAERVGTQVLDIESQIGICGVKEKDGKIRSIDERIKEHRDGGWKKLQVQMLIYFKDGGNAAFLERAVKKKFLKVSEPNGSEYFETDPTRIMVFIQTFLDMMGWKNGENGDYKFEASSKIEKYNIIAQSMKKNKHKAYSYT